MKRPPSRRAGGFPPFQLGIAALLILLSVTAFILLGRLGWAWWVRLLVIVGSLYALAGLAMVTLGRRDRERDSSARGGEQKPE
jgi:uncharacterized SAM-binding protein YcdF (DUF218 family)